VGCQDDDTTRGPQGSGDLFGRGGDILDTNADGWGDIPGLVSRLDYLSRLGVTALWLNPIHATPNRDDGYDVTDYYSVAGRLGTLGDFVDLVHEAGSGHWQDETASLAPANGAASTCTGAVIVR
jgi:glycosidase